MADRGEYRSIRRVLLDGPDFQKLHASARWCFVALKLNAGPTGFDVEYPSALAEQLAQQTGLMAEDVVISLAELETEGWIRREGNLLWIVGHLANDPHMKAVDGKHRKAVQRHVASLPRLRLVTAFIAQNPAFFPPSEAASMGLAWAFDGPSMPHRSTESESESEKETEKETESEKESEREREGPSRSAAPPAVPEPAPSDSPSLTLEDLGADVREFFTVFWPKESTSVARRKTVSRELLATLGAGALLKGERVFAGSIERLAKKCREVLAMKTLRDPDKAMAVLLTKLTDAGDIAAAHVAREQSAFAADDEDRAIDEWIRDHPKDVARIRKELRNAVPKSEFDQVAAMAELRTRVRHTLFAHAS